MSEPMDPMGLDLFPAAGMDDPANVAAMAWRMYPLPTPRWDVRCPCCRRRRSEGAIQLREWLFHYVSTSHRGARCDVGFKCLACSLAWAHGVPVPMDLFQRHHGLRYRWREGREILLSGEG